MPVFWLPCHIISRTKINVPHVCGRILLFINFTYIWTLDDRRLPGGDDIFLSWHILVRHLWQHRCCALIVKIEPPSSPIYLPGGGCGPMPPPCIPDPPGWGWFWPIMPWCRPGDCVSGRCWRSGLRFLPNAIAAINVFVSAALLFTAGAVFWSEN